MKEISYTVSRNPIEIQKPKLKPKIHSEIQKFNLKPRIQSEIRISDPKMIQDPIKYSANICTL